MPADAALQLQALTTSTATAHSTPVNIPGGTARRGGFVRFIYKNASNASGANSATFSVSVGLTSGGTFYAKTVDNEDVVNLSTTVQSGEIYLPIETSDPYIRSDVVIAGAGSTPTIDWQADYVPSRP